MIKFHYHTATRAVPRLGIGKGDPLCHVYSDQSRKELVAWGRRHELREAWIHERSLPHYDAFGELLAHCGRGVTLTTLKQDIQAWRRRAHEQPDD